MMNNKALVLASGLLFAFLTDALAITDGELDGRNHPFVGLMVAQDDQGKPLWRCSGTLISPKIFVTAGRPLYGGTGSPCRDMVR